MKYYDSMGFESENGIWVRRVDAAELEAICASYENRGAFKLAARVAKLEAALRDATELRESDLDAADEFTLRWRELLGSPSEFSA
jgi:hypothetical protein